MGNLAASELTAKIIWYDIELKRISTSYGWTVIRSNGGITKIIVRGPVRSMEIPCRGEGDIKALEIVLREIAQVYHALRGHSERKVPIWLPDDAKDFLRKATTSDQGLYPFGKEIKIESNEATYLTNEFLVIIEEKSAYAFRYYPVERNLYKGTIHVTGDVLYKVAMDTNSSWFDLIEIKGKNPEEANKRLIQLKNEIVKALIYTIGWGPGEATWKDELKTSLSYQHDIIKEGVGASKLDRVKRIRPRVRVR